MIERHVQAERTELAELLSGLDQAQWEADTLCDGWRVREVVAHMTQPFRMSGGRVVWELVKAGGRFNRMADRTARRGAARMSAAELTALLRDNAAHPWKPFGGGTVGALSHDVIHGLDITAGLGLQRRVPLERLAIVLGGVTPRSVAFFGVDLRGVQLQALDLDWSYGAGRPVRAPAQELLLALCGRRLPRPLDGLN
ncbi:maleylpyruvate isomerase family mycothiol-dependent enzyme [Dactylosporangium matsuzakiense]|uniref:Mycothiol-dependent maleylpyruvate isomerase metal-binding domain-containing protein n=1 Tax=Dactylosporangium matsuzakiense TaxID=53360 RepID=A0A9W6KQR1_9ACTN|nr:maleylpyruvate isomerase family mycothiol-dependent enzyme [Dactylosporangium matsuzakiense]GLL06421.1 hypothetical protein GCM10017581_081710 [Dactylosporangium matsuzakiense]